MAEARATLEWNQTSAVLAMIHNVNCTKPGQAKSAAEFNPMHKAAPVVIEKTKDLSILKTMYVDKKRG